LEGTISEEVKREVVDWSSEELKGEFDVIASFYQLKLGDKTYQCRNHALIIRKGYANQKSPEFVLVMANPGSCCPQDPTYQPPVVHGNPSNVPYVQAKHDQTMQQLMKLMQMKNWNIISIGNLSDLCAGNMKDFGEKLNQIGQFEYKDHSIFSDSRAIERKLVLNKDSKIIIAWGKNKIIRKLASEALCKLPKEKQILGLRYTNPSWGYRHPYPMIPSRCKEWLEDMCNQINGFDS